MTTHSKLPTGVVLAIFLVMPLSFGYGQGDDDATEYVQSPTNTFYLTCGEEPLPYQAHTATSAVLVSPDYSYRAFTHASLSAECANESEIFIRGPRDGTYRQLFSQAPQGQDLGNGVKIVDWSPNSRFLLAEAMIWQVGSDAGVGRKILLFDAPQDKFLQPNFDAVFKGLPNECWTDVRALGFSADNKILIKSAVRPYYDPATINPEIRSAPRRLRSGYLPSTAGDNRSAKITRSKSTAHLQPSEKGDALSAG